jgi:flagellar assembly protein FliH
MSAKLLPAQSLAEAAFRQGAGGWAELSVEGGRARTAASPADLQAGGVAHGSASAFEQELAAIQAELQRARQQAEAGASASYKSGFDDGFRQGLAKNQAELDGFRTQIASTLQAAEAARRELLERSEADLVRLSIAVAEKILNRQIQIDPAALEGLVKSSLERLAAKPVQCVRIHPDDHPVIEKALAQHGGNRALRIAPDRALARGSLLFDTDCGTLDSSIATQLEEIENGLVDRLRRSNP